MGSHLTKNNDETVIIIHLCRLQRFFENCKNCPEKEELLAHIPLKCNYLYNTRTMDSVQLFWYLKAHKPIKLHMKLNAGSRCKMYITKEYYLKLVEFGNTQKQITNNQI
jgi:hypothetical protein